MLVGTHVSKAGGFAKAPARAKKVGSEVMQIFSRSPRGGKAPKITNQEVQEFQDELKKNNIKEVYIHTPYYINLASANNKIRFGSIEIIRAELERASKLGVKYVMTHLGSANDMSHSQAIKKVISGLKKVLTGYTGEAYFLIENAAGSGKIMGDSFAEIGKIIKGIESNSKLKDKAGVCFDTCHAFASGYDIRSQKEYEKVMKEFDKEIGLKKLKLFHFNDSMHELDSRKDRHTHIGQGKIGKDAFRYILNDKRFKGVNAILETPENEDGGDVSNIKLLKKMRK